MFVERVWRSIKYEEIYLRAYESVSHARRCIGDYIALYNGRLRVRGHEYIDEHKSTQVFRETFRKSKCRVQRQGVDHMMATTGNRIPPWDSVIPRHLDVDSVLKSLGSAWTLTTGSAVPSTSRLAAYVVICAGVVIGLFYLLELLLRLSAMIDSIAARWDISLGDRGPVRRARRNFCAIVRHRIEGMDIDEAWSDRHFAELEAEVIAEGGYYRSTISRMLKRPTFGQHKARRLIDAIRNSTEKRILLVGEPGSGKSVALRHLTAQLAARARRASRCYQIPIYVNLRELPAPPDEGPSAEFIAQFIRDQAGKVLAAGEYVSEHWEDHGRDGRWFFLLDSFDEIPAVMHADLHSPVIDQYSLAIRRCLEGMPDCRAVVASREYKAPSLHTWERFRVLALSPDLQEQLITRSLVEERATRVLARRYVAESRSDVFRNPMFLTLLCEDIKREHRAPASEFDLLHRHVAKLLHENSKRLGSQYQVSEAELTTVARGMARALAESSSLGLAPTFNELCEALCTSFLGHEKLRVALNALVWMKVLRSDVRDGQAGDQRYAFFHRRYQEAIVVDLIANGRLTVALPTLLTSDHWREYTVTLLQSQTEAVVQPIIDEAIRQIRVAADDVAVARSQFGGETFQHFELEQSRLIALLKLLDEGLRDRPDLRSSLLAAAVSNLVNRFWKDGDMINQFTLLTISSLSEKGDLEERIRSINEEPSDILRREAFLRLSYLPDIPDDLISWLRDILANDILDAKRNCDLQKIEVIVFRLPSRVGATVIWKRCLRIRRLIVLARPIVAPVYGLVHGTGRVYASLVLRRSSSGDASDYSSPSLNRPVFKFVTLVTSIALFYVSLYVTISAVAEHRPNATAIACVTVAWAIIGSFIASFRFRSAGAPLSPAELCRIFCRWHQAHKRTYARSLLHMVGWLTASGTLLFMVGALMFSLAAWLKVPLGNVFLITYLCLLTIGAGFWLIGIFTGRISVATMHATKESFQATGRDIAETLTMARNVYEARRWLSVDGHNLLGAEQSRRAFISWVAQAGRLADWRSRTLTRRLREIAWKEAEPCIEGRKAKDQKG